MCFRCGRFRLPPARGGSRASIQARGLSTLHPAAPSSSLSAPSKTRDMALASFEGSGLPTLPLIGKNLIAHLRSNLVIRVPGAAISGLSAAANELQTAALFVKGRATRQNGDLIGQFHLQISASGGGNSVGAEDELFRKVPDVDFYDQLRTSTDTHVAIAIRGLGEMEPADPANAGAHPSRVELSTRTDEYGVRRASVLLTQTPRDQELWNAMDAAMQKVANIFANGQPMQVIQNNRDGLGTTHHEAGTLWMGTDPTKSVTDGDGAFTIPKICTRRAQRFFPASVRRTQCSRVSHCPVGPATSSWRPDHSPLLRVSKAYSTASRSATGRCRRSATNLSETTPAPFGFDGVCWRDGSGRISAFSGLRGRRPPAMYCGCNG